MNQLNETLRQVAEETLSSLAFMFPLSDEEGDADQAAPMRWAAVDFSGPFSGHLTIAVQADMVAQLATNMLGLGEEPADALQQDDALKELANVICGNLLPMVGTPADVFNVSEPRLLAGDDCPSNGGLEPTASARLKLDAGSAAVALYVSEALPSACPAGTHEGGSR